MASTPFCPTLPSRLSVYYVTSTNNLVRQCRTKIHEFYYSWFFPPPLGHSIHFVPPTIGKPILRSTKPHKNRGKPTLHMLGDVLAFYLCLLVLLATTTTLRSTCITYRWKDIPTIYKTTALLLIFVFFFGDSLISWCSKKQHIVSRSNTEVQYRALADITFELHAHHWLLEDMGVTHSLLIVIHCDNRSTIQIAHNYVFYEHTKHIEIDCHLMHHLSTGTLRLLLVSLFDQTANIFTKTFPPDRLCDLVFKLKMAFVKPPWVWGGMLAYVYIIHPAYCPSLRLHLYLIYLILV